MMAMTVTLSLVSRKLYELDSLTRKHLTVHAHYAQNPSRVNQRFPFIESLTLKGVPHKDFQEFLEIHISGWIVQISVKFKFLKALHIRDMLVNDDDLELLATTRDTHDICGDTGLQVIGLCCKKLRKLTYGERVTHMGLIALAQGCYNLEYLHVRLSDISNEAMDKLRRLRISLCNGGLTDVGLGYIGKYGHNLRYLFLGCTGESDAGLLELSKGCQKLRKLILEDCAFSEQAVATFVFNIYSLSAKRSSLHGDIAVQALKSCRVVRICKEQSDMFRMNLNCLHQIEIRRYLRSVAKRPKHTIGSATSILGEENLNISSMSVGDTTKKKKKQAVMVIGVDGKPSNAALKKIDEIPVVEEFVFLVLFEFTRYEYDVQDLHLCSLSLLRDAFIHALRLEDFSGAYYRKDIPLENGIRAMLTGCNKLERLDIILHRGGLTDVGLGFIEKYGHNLKYLSLDCIGESDA
nr:hypothetical protein [Tanacetum cinerariifolium]